MEDDDFADEDPVIELNTPEDSSMPQLEDFLNYTIKEAENEEEEYSNSVSQ